mgnify:CR=1 FL=1|jgi:glycosyltransferase involved in cell wall biosynthesis
MKKEPLVSVIMSIYNGEKYLKESVWSILKQTYENFEFIIIDDGSTDETLNILNTISDLRLKIISKKNTGLTKSLNYAIGIAKGDLIARIDVDDIANQERLAVQVDFLIKHPKVALCGSWAKFIDEVGNEIGKYKVPINYSEIKHNILLHNPIIHSSVMFRKKVFNQVHGYNEKYRYAQDYELWGRIVPKYEVINLPQYLIKYRKLDTGITKSKNLTVRWIGLKIRCLILLRLLKKKLVKKL